MLLRRAPEDEQRAALAAAGALLHPGDDHDLGLAVAFRAALEELARTRAVIDLASAYEPILVDLADEDRLEYGLNLARVAIPALGVDVDLMKDEGWRFVATYPPEGSEGVDVNGKAARWLTRRMTVDGDGPRVAMRRFLALLAEQVEIELPVSAATLDALLEEPPPERVVQDRLFVAVARTLVDEAVTERGRPW